MLEIVTFKIEQTTTIRSLFLLLLRYLLLPLLFRVVSAHARMAGNELLQLVDSLAVAAATDDENASVENRWCQLQDKIHPTALVVLGHARRQHQDWSEDKDAAIDDLHAELNHLHKAYVGHLTDDNRNAFYRCRRLLQQRLHEIQDAWTARKAQEIQGHADSNEWKNFFSEIEAVYCPPAKKQSLHQCRHSASFPLSTDNGISAFKPAATDTTYAFAIDVQLYHLLSPVSLSSWLLPASCIRPRCR
nr:unnamed protein product [Spirometra erinaceieuropaei]